MGSFAGLFLMTSLLFAALGLLGLSGDALAADTHAQVSQASQLGAVLATQSQDDETPDVASDSPRASVQRFLEQCRAGQWEAASTYLELGKTDAKRGTALAEELCAILNRKLHPDADDLSPLPGGRKDDGLPAGTDELGRIATSAGVKAPVRIIRRDAREGEEARWIFSQATVTHVDDWYETLGDRWIRRALPPTLLREGPHGFLLWQMLAAPLFVAVAVLLGRAAARVTVSILGALTRRDRAKKTLIDARRALALLLSVLALRLAMPWGGLYLTAYDLVIRVLAAATVIGGVWFVIVATRTTAGVMRDRAANTPGRFALISLGERASRAALVLIGLLWAISEFGYQVSSLVAGLGIGGIAVALAAQKTLENLFGSVAILADQPFRIGELVRVDGTEGTVETIGLRSTRIRTLDRTVVVIPNGKLADMKVESFGTRDRYRLQLKIELRAGNDPAQVEKFLVALRETLATREAILPEDRLVNAQRLVLGVLEIEASGYVKTDTLAKFYEEREAVALMALTLAKTHALTLAERTP
jgi:MscS family membrane protein